MSRYATDGGFPIDNNPVENIIRPIAIGKKLSAVGDYAQYRTPRGVGSRRTYDELCIISKAFEELQSLRVRFPVACHERNVGLVS